jgi:hypothetical protein
MMRISTVLAALALTVAAATSEAQAPAAAAPLASQETNWPGVTADLTEFRRKGNTLTVKVRLTAGAEKSRFEVDYGEVYLMDTSAGKKYELLKDDKGAYIAATNPGWPAKTWGDIEPGQSRTLWMKFPAPPAEVKAITLSLPSMAPFEDVAIQD